MVSVRMRELRRPTSIGLTLIDMAIALGVMSILAAVIVPNALEFARKRQVEAAVRQTHSILDAAKWFWVSHTGRRIPLPPANPNSRLIAHRPPPNIQPLGRLLAYGAELPVDERAAPAGLGQRGYYVGAGNCMEATVPPAPGAETNDALCNARVRWGSYAAAQPGANALFALGVGYRDGTPAPAPAGPPSFWFIPNPVPAVDAAFDMDEATGYWPGQLERTKCSGGIDFELAKKELATYLGMTSTSYHEIFINPWQEEYLISLDDCSQVDPAACAQGSEMMQENCWLTLSSNIPEQHATTYKRMVPLGMCLTDGPWCPAGPTAIPADFTRCCSRIPWPGKEPRFRRWRPLLEDWYCAPWETTKEAECIGP